MYTLEFLDTIVKGHFWFSIHGMYINIVVVFISIHAVYIVLDEGDKDEDYVPNVHFPSYFY